jgi:cytochrome b6-f complex iron-sulfur subunit
MQETSKNIIEIEKMEINTIDRKEFMRQVGLSFGAIMLMNCLQSCSDGGEIPDPNPNTSTGKVDFTININDATYSALKTKGNFVVVSCISFVLFLNG